MNKKLFAVYGTLRKGHGNSRLFDNPESTWLGEFITKPEYTMYSLGGFPAVAEKGNTAITCEVWETTSEDVIKNVFRLEGCTGIKGDDRNWYDFVDIETPYGIASMFTMNECQEKNIVEDGNWNNHISIRRNY